MSTESSTEEEEDDTEVPGRSDEYMSQWTREVGLASPVTLDEEMVSVPLETSGSDDHTSHQDDTTLSEAPAPSPAPADQMENDVPNNPPRRGYDRRRDHPVLQDVMPFIEGGFARSLSDFAIAMSQQLSGAKSEPYGMVLPTTFMLNLRYEHLNRGHRVGPIIIGRLDDRSTTLIVRVPVRAIGTSWTSRTGP